MLRVFLPALLLPMLLAGCQGHVIEEMPEQKEEEQLPGILGQLFQEKINLSIYRLAVERLNGYYDHHGDPSKKAMTLSAGQDAALRAMISELKSDFDRARRIDEVKNRLFSVQADASYLDSCLLFRDALQALSNDMGEAPPKNKTEELTRYQLDLVKHVFGWTMRQVALRNNPPSLKDWPAHELLRLGRGDGEDRLRIFLGVMSQSDIDACGLAIKSQVRRDNIIENSQTLVLAGVLIDKKLYLFDPYTGQPVAGPGAGTVATLEDLKKNPALLAARADGPSATQLAEGELVLLTPVSALAPRMEELEKAFDGIKVRVRLMDDVAGRIERFKAAGLTVKPWSPPNRSGFPGLVFQRYVEVARNDPRLEVVVQPRAKLIPKWALEAEQKVGRTGTQQSLLYEFDRLFVSVRLESGGGRDLLVRGKPHMAVSKLSLFENRVDRALDTFHKEMAYSVPQFREHFLEPLAKASAALRLLLQQMEAMTRGSPEERDLDMKRRQLLLQLDGAWKDQTAKSVMSNLGAEWAVPELREHLSYFMGLAKMELAIQTEMRYRRNPSAAWPEGTPTPADLYGSALEWFDRYEALIIPLNSNLWLDAVKQRSAECRSRQAAVRTLMATTVKK